MSPCLQRRHERSTKTAEQQMQRPRPRESLQGWQPFAERRACGAPHRWEATQGSRTPRPARRRPDPSLPERWRLRSIGGTNFRKPPRNGWPSVTPPRASTRRRSSGPQVAAEQVTSTIQAPRSPRGTRCASRRGSCPVAQACSPIRGASGGGCRSACCKPVSPIPAGPARRCRPVRLTRRCGECPSAPPCAARSVPSRSTAPC